MGLGGVILAAGESTRMGRDKALLPWPADAPVTSSQPTGTLLSAAIKALNQYCDFVVVVAGNNAEKLRAIVDSSGASLTINPEPDRGQFSSLQVGLAEVLSRGRDAAMVTLVDRPPPVAATLDGLVTAFERRDRIAWAVVPEFEGKHGHPIVIAREMIEVFLKAAPTSSAREIEHAHQQHISYVPVSDSRVAVNINTPEDYASLCGSNV
jgi:CTP:molybdopterin cytidylyltransferase MocA